MGKTQQDKKLGKHREFSSSGVGVEIQQVMSSQPTHGVNVLTKQTGLLQIHPDQKRLTTDVCETGVPNRDGTEQ